MMTLREKLTAVTAFALLAAAIATALLSMLHNTPIIIRGGSILAQLSFPNFFNQKAPNVAYEAIVNTSDHITATGLKPIPPWQSAPPPHMTSTGGWAIFLSGVGPDNTQVKPNVAQVCSTADCSANGFGPGDEVYVIAGKDSQWKTELLWLRLRYHDMTKGCEIPSGNFDGVCDQLTRVRIVTHNPIPPEKIPYDHVFFCEQRSCVVEIGK